MLTFVTTTSRKTDLAALAQAEDWAGRLGVTAVPRRGRSIAVLCREEGVGGALVLSSARPPTFVSADGAVAYYYHPGMALTRIRNLVNGLGDPMVRAMELREGDWVLDCTLGRASDAVVASYVIGAAGRIVGVEASPLLAELTRHGLQTYRAAAETVTAALRRIQTVRGDHLAYLSEMPDKHFDVVYFDPVFERPVEASSAMVPLRPLADGRPLAEEAIQEARRVARRCVVVKERPRASLWGRLDVHRFISGKGSSVIYGVINPS